jgi:hypothetical protein
MSNIDGFSDLYTEVDGVITQLPKVWTANDGTVITTKSRVITPYTKGGTKLYISLQRAGKVTVRELV